MDDDKMMKKRVRKQNQNGFRFWFGWVGILKNGKIRNNHSSFVYQTTKQRIHRNGEEIEETEFRPQKHHHRQPHRRQNKKETGKMMEMKMEKAKKIE